MTIKIIHESLPKKLHPRFQNLLGNRFHSLTVVEFAGYRKNRTSLWRCFCDCGNYSTADTGQLNNGSCKSCGCLVSQNAIKRNTTHNRSYSREYRSWTSMRERCYKEYSISFESYGARGITVCDRWNSSFENFYIDMGSRPEGMTIDRIDPNGNYELSNCRWANNEDQANNKRCSNKHTYKGITLTIAQFARKYNIKEVTLKKRISYGWTLEKSLETKVIARAKRDD